MIEEMFRDYENAKYRKEALYAAHGIEAVMISVECMDGPHLWMVRYTYQGGK